MMGFEKVGRLKPDAENGTIRVIVDDVGDIGTISRERMEAIVEGIEPLLISGSEVIIELRVGNEMIRILGWQVKNMINKWPGKKTAIFC